MKLVEIIKGQRTSQEVFDAVFALCQEIGKTPVAVNEAPGFVVNRILIPMVNEAVGILADGVASRDDIDAAMKLGPRVRGRQVPSSSSAEEDGACRTARTQDGRRILQILKFNHY